METPEDEIAGLCDRCLKELVNGRGEFYEIGIDARVDSSPPILDSPTGMSREEIDRQWGEAIREMESMSQVDAESQVHCRRHLLLCSPCFQVWIENPAGTQG